MAPDLTRRDVSLGLLSAGLAWPARPWRVLVVVAHPDDEYYVAATVYRLAQELNATVDQMVVTNGEGGYRYSALAERYYGLKLTDERTGRAHLPAIRKRETVAAGRVLGVRHHYFLDQPDHGYTHNEREALDGQWNVAEVKRALRERLEREGYDFVFTLWPTSRTHGHHQAVAHLAAEVVGELDDARRPVLLGADTGEDVRSAEPALELDRRREFGPSGSLSYQIVAHWVIAEHKSQGMFQNDWGKCPVERFWPLGAGPANAAPRIARLHADLC